MRSKNVDSLYSSLTPFVFVVTEKEKCLEKLCEMQSFLPFLDFMIDKIKKKNVFPLECQLSKFQHIRSVILEKNGKYSLEGLTNIEDILQKLITKLDYKVSKCLVH